MHIQNTTREKKDSTIIEALYSYMQWFGAALFPIMASKRNLGISAEIGRNLRTTIRTSNLQSQKTKYHHY